MLPSKSVMLTVAKVAFVVAIFALLFSSGKFDLTQLSLKRLDWGRIGIAFALVAFSMFLMMIRYWYVLRCINIRLSLAESFRIGFISLFFTHCVFGTLSGELVRATYTAPFAEKKSSVLSAILFDRFNGVLSLATLCVIGLALNVKTVHQTWLLAVSGVIFLFFCFVWQALLSLCFLRYLGRRTGVAASYGLMAALSCFGLSLFAGEGGSLAGMPGLFLGGGMVLAYAVYASVIIVVIVRIVSRPEGGRHVPSGVMRKLLYQVESVLRSCVLFIGRPRVLATTLALALAAQFSYVLALLSIGAGLPGSDGFHFVEGILAAPMTFLMQLFPFPGAGAGVNEVSFGYLMEVLAGSDISLGVGSYLIFRCVLICLSLIGVPLFFLRKKAVSAPDGEH